MSEVFNFEITGEGANQKYTIYFEQNDKVIAKIEDKGDLCDPYYETDTPLFVTDLDQEILDVEERVVDLKVKLELLKRAKLQIDSK